MVAVSPTGQYPYVSAQVPFEILAAGQTSATVPVVITVNGVPSPAVQASIVASQPGIFTIPATGLGNAILVFTNPVTSQPAIAAPASAGISYASAPVPRGTNGFSMLAACAMTRFRTAGNVPGRERTATPTR